MAPSVVSLVPTIYGNIPSFLGARPIKDLRELRGLDAVVAGLPWEGTNTWGSFSGCEQTPKACRAASVRYGSGYLPEYDVEVMSSLKVGDLGDLPTHPSDVTKTFAGFEETAAAIFAAGVVPGLLMSILFMGYLAIKAHYCPEITPFQEERVPFRQTIVPLLKLWPLALIMAACVGPIYAGLATPTESGGIGAIASIIIGLIFGRLRLKSLCSV